MTYNPDTATSGDVSALQTALNQKANASTVGGLSTAVSSKASQSALDAAVAMIPVPAQAAPRSEANSAAVGASSTKYALEDHRHPRLTSTTVGVIGASSTAVIMFTRSFDKEPGINCTEIPPESGTMNSQPAVFRVDEWQMVNGQFAGCTVRAWRGQLLPTLASVSGLLSAVITGVNAIVTALTGYNPMGASVNGTRFSCIAVQRSD